MKNKDLQELLQKYPDDMEVIFHYRSDLENVYDNDFVAYNTTLGYCSYKSSMKENNEVYGKFMSPTYNAVVGYDSYMGGVITEHIPLIDKNVFVLEVSTR